MTNIRTTDDVEMDKIGLPIGIYKAMAISEEDRTQGDGIIVEFEVLEGADKGSKGKVWYLFDSDNTTTRKIAEQNLKRLSDATGKPIPLVSIDKRPAEFAPIKGRVLTLDVQTQKKNPAYTEIKRYLPEDYKVEEKASF